MIPVFIFGLAPELAQGQDVLLIQRVGRGAFCSSLRSEVWQLLPG